jgi:superfamily I DNA/RNA helicase
VFHHVIIDEYQDTNAVQERLFFKLAEGSKNLCVVGDDDQSLYRFRGATVQNIVDFPARCKHNLKQHPTTIPLGINYRSRSQIVEFCADFITRCDWAKPGRRTGYYRVVKKNITAKSSDRGTSVIASKGGKPDAVCAEIAHLVRDLIKTGKVTDPNQIAFLIRTQGRISRSRLRNHKNHTLSSAFYNVLEKGVRICYRIRNRESYITVKLRAKKKRTLAEMRFLWSSRLAENFNGAERTCCPYLPVWSSCRTGEQQPNRGSRISWH